MKRFLFYLLLLPVFLSACRVVDDDNINAVCTANCTEIRGRFVTGASQEGIANVALQLGWQNNEQLFVSRTREIATTQTDGNGNFSFTFLAEEEELTEGFYFLNFSVDEGSDLLIKEYQDQHLRFYHIDQRDTIVDFTYTIPTAGAFITLEITNLEAIKEDEKLLIDARYNYGMFNNFKGNALRYLSGYTQDSVITVETAANAYTLVRVRRDINGESLYTNDTVYIAAGDTLVFPVRF